MKKLLKVPSIPVQLLLAVVIASIAAIVFGQQPVLDYTFSQIGKLFMDLLKMLVVPLAFVSITSAIVKLGAERLRALSAWFIGLTVMMCLIGFALGFGLMSLVTIAPFTVDDSTVKAATAPTALEFLRSCIPVNPFKALADGKMLQVITLSFFIGFACFTLDEKGAVVHGFDVAQKICIRIANLVMHIAPLGVFCLLYPVMARNLAGVVTAYVQMTLMLIVGVLLYMALVCLPLLFLFKVSQPFRYFRTIILQDVVGAIAGGSMTYLAPRIANLKANTDLEPDVIDFFIPITAVLTRMGSTICVGIYTVFAASIFQVSLSWEQLLVCAFLTIIALMCAPGIIGGTLMDCAIIWSAIGLPIEAIAYIAGIDYIIDVLRTILNIQGGEIITACMNRFSEPLSSSCEKEGM